MRRFGTTFHLNLDDNAQRLFYYTGWYERPFLEFLDAELRPDDVYLDIGAHVGIDAVYAASRCKGVVAFEPGPDTAQALAANTRRVGNVFVVRLALGDTAEVVPLRTNPKWSERDLGVRSLHGDGDVVAQVSVVPFDEWALDWHDRIDVVKIDVEGSELAVVRGMLKALARFAPRVVAVELNHLSEHHDETRRLLDQAGYVYDRTIIENAVFRLKHVAAADLG